MKEVALRHMSQAGAWDQLWKKRSDIASWDYMSHVVFSEVMGFLPSGQNGFILEAGSGSGRISARIATSCYKVLQLDNSLQSLFLSRTRWRGQSHFLAGDIRQVPVRDQTCDVVWNCGVLEHFPPAEVHAILQEFKRITKPGGKVVMLVPNAWCIPYRVGKWLLQAVRMWPYGDEEPFRSMREIYEKNGLRFESEYSVAFTTVGVQNLLYIPGLRTMGRWLAHLACWLYGQGPLRQFDRWISALLGGYLLVCVARRE